MAVRKGNGVVAVVAAFLLGVLTSSTQQCVAEDHLRCRKHEFLTTNRTLLPLNNITAFINPLYPAPLVGFVDKSTMPWCPDHESTHVNMTFTKPVVVEGITSRGLFTQGMGRFVSNFSVFVSPSLNSNEELKLLDEEFTAPNRLQVYMIVDSFVAQRLQFRINEFATAYFCWQIQLVGCVAENAVVTNTGTDQPSCSSTTSTPRVTDQPSCSLLATTTAFVTVQPSCSLLATTTSFVTVQPSCTVNVGGAGAARQSAANGVIGGGTVLLVVGVVLMVVAFIIVCVVVLTRRKKSSHESVNLQPHQSHMENERSQTILRIENVDLYTSNSHDDGLLTNRLYDMDESTLAEPERDTVQPVQTTTAPSLNYDTAIDDQQAESERNIYSSIDEQQDQTTPTVTHRNQSQVNDERYSEVACNTNKGEDSGAADVYASIDT